MKRSPDRKKRDVIPLETKTASSKSPSTVLSSASAMARSWSLPSQLSDAC